VALAVLLGNPLAVAQDVPAKPDAPAGAQMTEEETAQAVRALQILAANGDREAFDIIARIKEGGQFSLTREESQKFIDRAKQLQGGGEKIDAQELVNAIEKMAADGDADAVEGKKYVDKARDSGTGRLEMPRELLGKIVTKAREKGLMKAPEGGGGTAEPPKDEPKAEPVKPDMDRATEAIRVLAKDGDKEAQDFIDNFRKTKKLELSDDEARAFIDRAVAKNLIKPEPANPGDGDAAKTPPAGDKGGGPAPDMERVKEAVKLLAKKGDKEARDAESRARRNKGDLGLTNEQASAMIERAVEKGLLEEVAANPGDDEMPPGMMKSLIERLAQDGDRTAKSILRKQKKGEELKYTDEQKKKILESAREAGLL
jgi:hypothetical protein